MCQGGRLLQLYELEYRVFDDKFANTTTVKIQVIDVNDNAPRFEQAIYNVTDIVEEDRSVGPGRPKYLLTVRREGGGEGEGERRTGAWGRGGRSISSR